MFYWYSSFCGNILIFYITFVKTFRISVYMLCIFVYFFLQYQYSAETVVYAETDAGFNPTPSKVRNLMKSTACTHVYNVICHSLVLNTKLFTWYGVQLTFIGLTPLPLLCPLTWSINLCKFGI